MKTTRSGIRQLAAFFAFSGLLFAASSCSKSSNGVSAPQTQIANAVKPGNVGGTIKGVFLKDSVYYVTSDVVVNKGDTVIFQPGVKVYFKGNFSFFIHGNLSSVGTKADPVWFTVQNQAKYDNPTEDPTADPAYKGLWGGLVGDSTSSFIILKYTHVEFSGGVIATSQTFGIANGDYAPAVKFTNVNGFLDVEDSWIYGCIDGNAAISIKYGSFNVMRNIFEKCGIYGSENVEVGNGCKGNVAYNLMMGTCTNGIKVSNGGTLFQDDVSIYNNTILNSGFRRYDYGGAGNQGGRGGSISFEQNAKGQVYNNLLVNCRIGLRIVGTGDYSGNALLIADTAHMFYGNNYNYADSAILTEQFYPQTFLTKPMATDIPAPSSFLPVGYALGATYNGSSLITQNNPQFVNYPLPLNLSAGTYYTLDRLAYVGSYDFHLKSTSPAIGKGTTSFTVTGAGIPVDPNFGATQVTPPGTDIGCYQSNGSGLTN